MKLLAPYRPLTWQIEPWKDKSPVVVVAGPAGTGKSRLGFEKIHGYMLHYPHATGLVLRKTRESLGNSFVLQFLHEVVGGDPRIEHVKSEHRFEYSNGSTLIYAGMRDEDQREQVRGIGSSGIDFALMEEAIKFGEDDYNEVIGRMRGHAASWQQIMLITNPGPPSHFINQRLILGGEASVYDKATPEDNPALPPAYIEGLRRLTGVMRQRLYEGLWVQAEGLVYDQFDLKNLTENDPDLTQPFELAYDDGYVDPRAILFIQQQGSEVLVFEELGHSHHVTDKCVREVLEVCVRLYAKALPEDWNRRTLSECASWCAENSVQLPEIAVGSPEAKELQEKFRQANIPTRRKVHEVVEGIEVVRSLICDGNDVRTLQVNRRCKGFIRELTETYVYPDGKHHRDSEKPKDGDDHFCDAFRYWAFLRT